MTAETVETLEMGRHWRQYTYAKVNAGDIGDRLICTVIGSTDTPTITWLGPPNGGSLPSGVGDTRMVSDVMSSGSTHASILQFDPLQSSHEGIYTCQATARKVLKMRSVPVYPQGE